LLKTASLQKRLPLFEGIKIAGFGIFHRIGKIPRKKDSRGKKFCQVFILFP